MYPKRKFGAKLSEIKMQVCNPVVGAEAIRLTIFPKLGIGNNFDFTELRFGSLL